MEKTVWHKGMACKIVTDGLRCRVWESKASGQREMTIYPRKLYIPIDNEAEQGPPNWLASDVWGAGVNPDVDLDELHRRAELSAKKAAKRARQNCRHKIKNAGLNEMLTLTYRENMTDLARMRRDMAAWLRVMRRLIPGFRAVYGFEQQGRGAWHTHIATDKLPMLMHYRGARVKSWKVGTAVWRAIVPQGGMCFVGGRKGRFNRGGSPGKIAAYIAGYLTKENAAGAFGKRMWDSTRDLTPPQAVTFDLPRDCTMADAISLAFELRPGHRVLTHRLSRDGDIWTLHTEPE